MKHLIILLGLLFSLQISSSQEPVDTDGNGYRNISTLDQLRWISENDFSWSWNFELDNDIDASDTRNWNVGEHDNDPNTPDSAMGWIPLGHIHKSFTGKFNGNNHKISSLYINRPIRKYAGFLGFVNNSEIYNIQIIDFQIVGYEYSGGLLGYCSGTKINNCNCNGKILGHSYIGGMIGISTHSRILNSFSSCNVSGIYNIGGMCGMNGFASHISNSECKSAVYGSSHNIGGIAGYSEQGTIDSCKSQSDVYGDAAVGGICGYLMFAQVNSCENFSSVLGYDKNIGGIVGYSNSSRVSYSRNEGEIWSNDDNTGGICGYSDSAVTIYCVNNSKIEGKDNIGGIIGESSTSIVKFSFNTGDIIGENGVGGLIGHNLHYSLISNSYNIAEIYGDAGVGGLVGTNEFSNLENSYNCGKLSGKNFVSGLTGYNSGGTATSCFWDIETAGDIDSTQSARNTQVMKTKSTFTDAGWDFETIWNIDGVTNDGYPFFRDGITSVEIANSNEIKDDILIFPNPASGYIEVSFINPTVNNMAEGLSSEIRIYNIFGELVLSTSVNFVDTSSGEGHFKINISHLPKGTYYLKVDNLTKKFVKGE